jgi:Flp pilus assembly protein TadG
MFDQARNRVGDVARRVLGLKSVRRFARHEDGSAAIEFGMVALPFLALMFAIIETAMVFWAGQVLETASANSARTVMTGQAQTKKWDEAKFKEEVCKNIMGLFDCGKIKVDVKTYTGFSDVDSSKPIDKDGKLIENFTYQPGGPGDIVVVRLLYEWPVYVTQLGLNLTDMAGSKRLLVATSAFRNEPY